MANENLPNIVTSLADGNLNTRQAVDLGDQIILMGTASQGPMNEPRTITSVQQAEELYGSVDQGNLVQGFAEVFFSPGGPKDVRCVRIGDGNRSSLDVEEALGSGIANETVTGSDISHNAISIAAKDPGEIHNTSTLRQEVVSGQLSIVFFNPITELETIIPVDFAGLVDNSVANAEELVNALNLDTNFSTHYEASVNLLTASFTLTAKDTDSWVDVASGSAASPSGNVDIDLATALDLADTTLDDLTDDASIVTVGTPVTAGNNLKAITEAFALQDQVVELDAAGKSQVTLPDPVQTLSGVAIDFLKLDLTTDVVTDGIARHIFTNNFIGTGTGDKVTFEFTAFEPIDVSTLKVFRTGQNGSAVEITGFAVGSVGGDANSNVASIILPSAPPINHIVTATYESEDFSLTKATTLTAVKDSNSFAEYFAAGTKLFFGQAQPADLRIAYKARKIFTDGQEVAIEDAKNGQITFQDQSNLPDVWQSGGVDIFLTIQYLPEFPNLTGGARSLSGGTNGINLTNAKKFDSLANAYTALEDTPTDIIVPLRTYIDDTKKDFDTETGIETDVPAGFAEQLNAHALQLLDGVSETYGVIAVKPIEPADGRSVKASDIETYITKLTVFSFSDVTRAANIMKNLDAKQLDVIAFEPVISNPAVRIPYTTSGEAIYTGLVSKLESSSATTNKPLTGLVGLRYLLSARQLNTLTGARFVTARSRPGLGLVITDGVTAAATTSDWTRRSTWRIIVEAMKGVRTIGEPFIGEAFSGAKKAALDTAIIRHLQGMKEEGKLQDFDFQITQTRSQEVRGTASVRLILLPAFELRRLEVTVELRQS